MMNVYEQAQKRLHRTKIIARGKGENGVDGKVWILTKTMLIVNEPNGYLCITHNGLMKTNQKLDKILETLNGENHEPTRRNRRNEKVAQ